MPKTVTARIGHEFQPDGYRSIVAAMKATRAGLLTRDALLNGKHAINGSSYAGMIPDAGICGGLRQEIRAIVQNNVPPISGR